MIVIFGCRILTFWWVASGNGEAGVISGLCFVTDETSEIPEWKEAGIMFFLVLNSTRDPTFLQIMRQLFHYGVDTSGSMQVF